MNAVWYGSLDSGSEVKTFYATLNGWDANLSFEEAYQNALKNLSDVLEKTTEDPFWHEVFKVRREKLLDDKHGVKAEVESVVAFGQKPKCYKAHDFPKKYYQLGAQVFMVDVGSCKIAKLTITGLHFDGVSPGRLSYVCDYRAHCFSDVVFGTKEEAFDYLDQRMSQKFPGFGIVAREKVGMFDI